MSPTYHKVLFLHLSKMFLLMEIKNDGHDGKLMKGKNVKKRTKACRVACVSVFVMFRSKFLWNSIIIAFLAIVCWIAKLISDCVDPWFIEFLIDWWLSIYAKNRMIPKTAICLQMLFKSLFFISWLQDGRNIYYVRHSYRYNLWAIIL